MQYVVSAEEYFKSINESSNNLDQLTKYFENIPDAFFEALEKTDWSKLKDPFSEPVSEAQLSHQLFLLDHIDDIQDIVRKEDFLTRIGYDTVALRESGEYLERIQLIDEGALGAVWDFIKAMVEDPDPTEMTLNILRLVLDIIGIVPFTWAGLPIDAVANVMSGFISMYKNEWFSMVLSFLAATDVTKALALAKTTFKPIAPVLNKILPVFFRAGSEAVALEKVVLSAKEEIIKIGGKSLLQNVTDLFGMIGNFLVGSAVSVVKLIAGFIETALNLATFGAAKKYTAKIPQLVDKLAANITVAGSNFKSASKILSEEGGESIAKASKDLEKTAAAAIDAEKTALKKQAYSDAYASGKRGLEINAEVQKKLADSGLDKPIIDRYLDASGYLGELRGVVKETEVFANTISKLPKAQQDIWVAAKMENELIGQAKLSVDKIMKDPKLVEHLSSIGWRPGGNELIALARKGDEAGVKKFFETFLTDPKISKNLSKAEIRAFTPFVARPKAFVEGVKRMDDTIKVIKTMEKLGGTIGKRAIPLSRLINFLTRYFWQKYGSWECIKQYGSVLASGKAGETLSNLAASSLAPKPQAAVNEEEAVSTEQGADATATETQELAPEVVKELELNAKNKEALEKKKGKPDCGLIAAANSAIVASHVTKFPGSLTGQKDYKMGDDPKAREEFQKNSTEYTNQILKSMQLPPVEVQKAIEATDPTTQLIFSDVWDAENGVVSVNTSDASRMEKTADDLVKKGLMTREEADAAIKKAKQMVDTGNIPEVQVKTNANESLFKIKSILVNR